jgi:hypothetical protein
MICILGLFKSENFDYVRMASDNLILWLIYMFFEKRKNWQIPLYIRLITLLAITSNSTLGEYYNFYVTSPLFDRFQHIFGTYAVTLFSFLILQQMTQVKIKNNKFNAAFLICLSLALGSTYEIFEFLEDIIFNPTIKNQPSLTDTDLDLISDLCGGFWAVFHFLKSRHLKSYTFPFEKKSSLKDHPF